MGKWCCASGESQCRPVRAADPGGTRRQGAVDGAGPIGAGVQLNTEGAEGGFGTHICDVEVDVETRHRARDPLHNRGAGRRPALSIPAMSRARCRAGVAQGIGWALNEEYIYNKAGKVDNPGFP